MNIVAHIQTNWECVENIRFRYSENTKMLNIQHSEANWKRLSNISSYDLKVNHVVFVINKIVWTSHRLWTIIKYNPMSADCCPL